MNFWQMFLQTISSTLATLGIVFLVFRVANAFVSTHKKVVTLALCIMLVISPFIFLLFAKKTPIALVLISYSQQIITSVAILAGYFFTFNLLKKSQVATSFFANIIVECGAKLYNPLLRNQDRTWISQNAIMASEQFRAWIEWRKKKRGNGYYELRELSSFDYSLNPLLKIVAIQELQKLLKYDSEATNRDTRLLMTLIVDQQSALDLDLNAALGNLDHTDDSDNKYIAFLSQQNHSLEKLKNGNKTGSAELKEGLLPELLPLLERIWIEEQINSELVPVTTPGMELIRDIMYAATIYDLGLHNLKRNMQASLSAI
jgi:hypothetical protein